MGAGNGLQPGRNPFAAGDRRICRRYGFGNSSYERGREMTRGKKTGSGNAGNLKKRWNKYLVAGMIMTGIAVMLGVTGFFWTPYSTTAMSASERFAGPSLRHIFGTDNFGRDIFSRVMQGLGTTIGVSSLVVLFSGAMGILLGAFTGYFGGVADEIVMRITDALNGFPSILLTLVIISLLGTGRQNVIISLGLVFVPGYVRIVRGEFIRLRDADYIKRARMMGTGKFRILFIHILPNIFSVFWVSVMIGFNNAILAESGMSYLGIGVQPPDASLGNMLSDAQGYLQSAPWYAMAPGLTIVWVVLGFSLFSEGIRRRAE